MAINKIFVAKTRNYDIFVAKIYDYALIDSFWGFPRFINSPTSYATLLPTALNLNVINLIWHVFSDHRFNFGEKIYILLHIPIGPLEDIPQDAQRPNNAMKVQVKHNSWGGTSWLLMVSVSPISERPQVGLSEVVLPEDNQITCFFWVDMPTEFPQRKVRPVACFAILQFK